MAMSFFTNLSIFYPFYVLGGGLFEKLEAYSTFYENGMLKGIVHEIGKIFVSSLGRIHTLYNSIVKL